MACTITSLSTPATKVNENVYFGKVSLNRIAIIAITTIDTILNIEYISHSPNLIILDCHQLQ